MGIGRVIECQRMENVEVIRLSDYDFEIIADSETLQSLFEEEDMVRLRRQSVTIHSESDLFGYNDTELIDTRFDPNDVPQTRRTTQQKVICVGTWISVIMLAVSILILLLLWMNTLFGALPFLNEYQ